MRADNAKPRGRRRPAHVPPGGWNRSFAPRTAAVVAAVCPCAAARYSRITLRLVCRMNCARTHRANHAGVGAGGEAR